MLLELTRSVEALHPWTLGHGERVAELALQAARTLRWADQRLSTVWLGSLLHDIGKLSLSTELLGKAGALTPREQDEVRRHPAAGACVVASLPRARRACNVVLYHHERWDGDGYPSRLAGAAIPVEARLVALADAFDAMTSTRPYRPTLTTGDALHELARCAGTQFDPILTRVCIDAWRARLRVAV